MISNVIFDVSLLGSVTKGLWQMSGIWTKVEANWTRKELHLDPHGFTQG